MVMDIGRELVFFLHSTGTGPSLWRRAERVVAPRPSLFPANIGYAPSPPLPRGVRVTPADEAAHLLSLLPASAERVHLVAHSYGGLVALHLLRSLGARVASTFLYEPVLFGALRHSSTLDPEAAEHVRGFAAHPWFLSDEGRGGGDAWLEIFIDYWNRPGAWASMPAPVQQASREVGWKMFQEVRGVFFDETPFDAWPLDVPTTLVMGERTTIASKAMTRALADGRPNVRTVSLPDVGHMAPLTKPGPVHRELALHLARLGLEVAP